MPLGLFQVLEDFKKVREFGSNSSIVAMGVQPHRQIFDSPVRML